MENLVKKNPVKLFSKHELVVCLLSEAVNGRVMNVSEVVSMLVSLPYLYWKEKCSSILSWSVEFLLVCCLE